MCKKYKISNCAENELKFIHTEMTEVVVDPAVIKKTQQTLGKYVKKPVLAEKLLNKPPFRFIHDIVKAVIKETGFLDGLYTKVELDAENIRNRDDKIKFLQKLIDVIKLATNAEVSARPSKIVAGHEADKTNELLQLIGTAIDKKVDCKSAITSIKAGSVGKPTENYSKTKKVPDEDVKSKSRKDTSKESKDKIITSKERNKNTSKQHAAKSEAVTKKTDTRRVSKENVERKPKEKTIRKERTRKSEVFDDTGNMAKIAGNGITETPSQDLEVDAVIVHNAEKTETNKQIEPEVRYLTESNSLENGNKADESRNSSYPEGAPLEQNFSVERKRNSNGELQNDETMERKDDSHNDLMGSQMKAKSKDERKSSSKRKKSIADEQTLAVDQLERSENNDNHQNPRKSSDPKLRLQQISRKVDTKENVKDSVALVTEKSQGAISRPRTALRPPSVRPASARPGAPRRRDKNVEIVLQPNDPVKLAGINVRLENFDSQLEDDGENLVIVESADVHVAKDGRDNEKLLDEQTQQGHLVQQILQTQKELTQSDAENFSTNKETDFTLESSGRQMNSLRDVIQNLTKAINPLGKLMDFLPEDVDSMHLEMTMWHDTFIQVSNELKKERSLTECVVEPMENQLAQINASIKEYKELIDTIRVKILHNSEKIFKFLSEQ